MTFIKAYAALFKIMKNMTQRPVDEELLFLFDEREICEMLWIFFSLLGLTELSHFRGHKDCGSDLFRSLIV